MKQKRRDLSKSGSAGEPAPDKTPEYPVVGVPVVVAYESKPRKKKGSSRASRRLEDIDQRLSKSVHRVTKAVNEGVTTYMDQRDKSARKRRDGAVVDSYQNVAQGVSRTLAESSPVITDIAKAINTRRLRKRIRKILRGFPVIG